MYAVRICQFLHHSRPPSCRKRRTCTWKAGLRYCTRVQACQGTPKPQPPSCLGISAARDARTRNAIDTLRPPTPTPLLSSETENRTELYTHLCTEGLVVTSLRLTAHRSEGPIHKKDFTAVISPRSQASARLTQIDSTSPSHSIKSSCR